MMLNPMFDLSSSSDSEEEPINETVNANTSRQRRRNQRSSHDAFTMPDEDFRLMFRLSKSVAAAVIEEVLVANPSLRISGNSMAISFETKFLAALNFFANGSYQKPTAENRWFCQAQPTFSKNLHIVLDAMMKIATKHIHMPSTPDEVLAAKCKFLTKLKMPGVICAIDGSQIAIVQPPEAENGYLYYNRKQFYSLNALAACDSSMKFNFIDAQYPGSVHDSAIFQMTGLAESVNADGLTFLLGDSGFAASNIMLTPHPNAASGSPQAKYNFAHKHARNVVERAFGLLKSRWRCLLKHRVLHYSPVTAAKIIYACVILHNICVDERLEIEDDDDEADEVDGDDEDVEVAAEADEMRRQTSEGMRIRNAYIRRYFVTRS